ncbi:Serine/threonine-protein kinase [Rhizoctonia solani]|uniref:Serine/threonine-protein kinase n=1 Tax=Rhizoctonia solani TaxID=456999 RepID=A0A8H8NME7_9AGAM|nr:Serine/threonine-protein kinase [Rhizoctonia solani]QRW16471.1 Serine/threonine-protein kinase [Rhizoctonia solani]
MAETQQNTQKTAETQTETQAGTQKSSYEIEDTEHLNARLMSRNPMYPDIDLPKGVTTYNVGRKPRVNDIIMPQDWKRISGQHCILKYQEHPPKDDLILGISNPDPIIWVEDLSQSGTFINGRRVGEGNQILHVGEEICFGKPSQHDPAENHRRPTDHPLLCQYAVQSMLSSGTFGVVYKVLDKQTSDWAALKVIITGHNLHDPRALEREVNIHGNLVHENIIRLYAHHEEPGRLLLVMELAEYGDLQEYLKTHGPLSESLTRHIAWQVYQAVAFTHSMQVTHRDLKPENILITSLDPFFVKIADFGLAKAVDGRTFLKTFCGTQNYVAPEILQGAAGYGQMVDIYSLGVIFLFCMTGKWVLDYEALAILEVAGVSETVSIYCAGVCSRDHRIAFRQKMHFSIPGFVGNSAQGIIS